MSLILCPSNLDPLPYCFECLLLWLWTRPHDWAGDKLSWFALDCLGFSTGDPAFWEAPQSQRNPSGRINRKTGHPVGQWYVTYVGTRKELARWTFPLFSASSITMKTCPGQAGDEEKRMKNTWRWAKVTPVSPNKSSLGLPPTEELSDPVSNAEIFQTWIQATETLKYANISK